MDVLGKPWLLALMTLIAVLAVALPMGCGNMLTGDFDAAPSLPVGLISGTSVADYEFNLRFVDADGLSQAQIIGKLKELRDLWKKYEFLLDPRVYIGGSNPRSYAVFGMSGSRRVLNNNGTSMSLILRRYWPADEPGPLTVASWPGTIAKRKAAFLEAKGKIEGLMASLKNSVYWETESDELDSFDAPVKPLQQVYGLMETFIYDPGIYTDLAALDAETAGATEISSVHETQSGALYELYFGHIPEYDEYLYDANEKIYQ